MAFSAVPSGFERGVQQRSCSRLRRCEGRTVGFWDSCFTRFWSGVSNGLNNDVAHDKIGAAALSVMRFGRMSNVCDLPSRAVSAVLCRPGWRLAAAALVVGGTVTHAQAQSPKSGPAPQNTTVNVNYVYAASLGFGGYSVGGLTANVYTLPLSDTFHDVPEDGWAIKALLPVQVGFYDFNATVDGEKLSVSQQSLTVVPGAELQIPVTGRFVVKPFAQAGVGHSFGAGSGNPDAWVYLAGLRSVAEWHVGDYSLSVGNGAIYAGDATMGPGFGEHYVALQVAGEVRRPLGFKIGNWTPDIGVYVAEYYYPSPLQFSRFLHSPLRIDNQNEIGFSIGSAEPFKLLWLDNPRIGAGVVFGGGLDVYHVTFGFPF